MPLLEREAERWRRGISKGKVANQSAEKIHLKEGKCSHKGGYAKCKSGPNMEDQPQKQEENKLETRLREPRRKLNARGMFREEKTNEWGRGCNHGRAGGRGGRARAP
eukprot:2488170-Pleurochrysis_carterae.AAC.2